MHDLFLNENGKFERCDSEWDIVIHCPTFGDRIECLKLIQRNNKKPVDRSMVNDDGYAVDRCPTCSAYVDRTNYCPNCGQRLDHTFEVK